MLGNSLRIAVDSVFLPPEMSEWSNCHKSSCPGQYLESNRYELIFDSKCKVRNTISPLGAHYGPLREEEAQNLSDSSSCIRQY
jgi:hypothetical protein